MGRLIDEIEIYKRLRPKVDNGTLDEIMLDIPTVEAIPKDQYETRLKADMVAMLTEIQLDIQEVNTAPQFLTDDNVKDFRECVDTIIQQKINELMADQEGKNEIYGEQKQNSRIYIANYP